jgi:hypothetical protein
MRIRRPLVVALLLVTGGGVPSSRADESRPTTPAAADGRLTAARALVRGGNAAEAKRTLAALVASEPRNREARKALLEAAALTRDWNECNAQTAVLEPFTDGEEVSMFYAAVALRETGSIASARALVRRARPFLKPSRFVDWYTTEILGN